MAGTMRLGHRRQKLYNDGQRCGWMMHDHVWMLLNVKFCVHHKKFQQGEAAKQDGRLAPCHSDGQEHYRALITASRRVALLTHDAAAGVGKERNEVRDMPRTPKKQDTDFTPA